MLIGFGLWFIVALVQGLAVIVDPAATVGQADLLRSDRATGLRQGLTTGIFGAALIVAVLWEQFDFTYHLVSGTLCWVLAWAFAALAATGMWIFPGMVWGPWLIARCWLALRNRLPWNLMAFLEDAHRRGVLRQSGGVYQFRHARLQQYLATPPAPRPFQDHDVRPRMVKGLSMERPAHRVASVMSGRPASRRAPIARLRRAAMILGPFRVLTWDLSSW